MVCTHPDQGVRWMMGTTSQWTRYQQEEVLGFSAAKGFCFYPESIAEGHQRGIPLSTTGHQTPAHCKESFLPGSKHGLVTQLPGDLRHLLQIR